MSSLEQKNIITNEESIYGGHQCSGTTTQEERFSGNTFPDPGFFPKKDTIHDWDDEGCCGEE